MSQRRHRRSRPLVGDSLIAGLAVFVFVWVLLGPFS